MAVALSCMEGSGGVELVGTVVSHVGAPNSPLELM